MAATKNTVKLPNATLDAGQIRGFRDTYGNLILVLGANPEGTFTTASTSEEAKKKAAEKGKTLVPNALLAGTKGWGGTPVLVLDPEGEQEQWTFRGTVTAR